MAGAPARRGTEAAWATAAPACHASLASDHCPMRRAAVFAHFDCHDLVAPYVIHLLEQVRTVCDTIVFVSTSRLSATEVARVSRIVQRVVLRENTGRDFGSYREGILSLRDAGFDEILIVNDSVFGPLMPLTDVFARMAAVPADAWSATSSWAISFHLQSYFVVFRRRVLESAVFWAFWRHLRPQPDKDRTILLGEIGLSYVLRAQGFRLRSFLPPPTILHGLLSALRTQEWTMAWPSVAVVGLRHAWLVYMVMRRMVLESFEFGAYRAIDRLRQFNMTHSLWRVSVARRRLIFLKVDLLRDFPLRADTRQVAAFLRPRTTYDPALIEEHLRRVMPPAPPASVGAVKRPPGRRPPRTKARR